MLSSPSAPGTGSGAIVGAAARISLAAWVRLELNRAIMTRHHHSGDLTLRSGACRHRNLDLDELAEPQDGRR